MTPPHGTILPAALDPAPLARAAALQVGACERAQRILADVALNGGDLLAVAKREVERRAAAVEAVIRFATAAYGDPSLDAPRWNTVARNMMARCETVNHNDYVADKLRSLAAEIESRPTLAEVQGG